MNTMDRRKGSDKRYTGYKHGGRMRQDEKQGGQQENDGWVMVQKMRGKDVADDNEEGCTGSEQVAMSTGESLNVSYQLYARATPSTPAACFKPNHFSQA